MHAQQTVALIGTWRLLSIEVRYEDSTLIYPWGKSPVGQIMYGAEGFMSVVIASAERPRFAANDILGGSIDEQAQAARSYLSYVGSYKIQANRVVHHITASLFPNWVGEDQVRFIDEITSERLVLRTPPTQAAGKPGVGYLIWQRAQI